MRILLTFAAVAAILFLIGGHHAQADPHDPLPPGVTAGWPIDPLDPEDTTCGIGIHYEDTPALTDTQLDTARRYVAHACWGAPLDGQPTDPGRYYYHH